MLEETAEEAKYGTVRETIPNDSLLCKSELLSKENEALNRRLDSLLTEHERLCQILLETKEESILVAQIHNFSLMFSFLTINELLTARCVSSKLRNWCEFELKSRKEAFIITEKYRSDYDIFLNFKLFSNIKTLVVEKLNPSVRFTVLLRLCKDFLSELDCIVVDDSWKYMEIRNMYPKTEKLITAHPLAHSLVEKLREKNNFHIGENLIIYKLRGLEKPDEYGEEIERLRQRNMFLRDTSELYDKECARMKEDENLSLFSILPEEMTLNILGMLSHSDLFTLRLVSKEMKRWAEIAIRNCKSVLDVVSIYGNFSGYRVYLWSNLYSNIKMLTINVTDIDIILRIIEGKFPYLQNLVVYNCGRHQIEILGDYFPGLKKLTLVNLQNVCREISTLLSKLPELESLTITCGLNAKVAQLFTFLDRSARNMKSFTFENRYAFKVDCKNISTTLETEMPKLKTLSLKLERASFINFSDLNLMKIKELELCLVVITGRLTLPEKVTSVTKLTLNTALNSDTDLATVLSNFTNLNTLELDLFRNHKIKFTSTLLDALVNLKSLRYFSLFDIFYSKEKYCTLQSGNRNALIEVLIALKNVEKIKIEFSHQSYEDDDLVTAVNKLVSERSLKNIQLIIRTY